MFTLARALTDSGAATLEKRIGADATGQAFNSIVALGLNKLQKRPPPGNPFVNAGAIATVDLVAGKDAAERWKHILGTMNAFAGRALTVDEKVYKSETDTNARNQGISWILKADEVLKGSPPEILDLYTRQCSVAVTARDLVTMGATLANGGVNPRTGERVVDPAIAAQVLAVMATAGLYETTGTWMFRVGVPAKSGVGGGILAVAPGRYAIAAFAPPLDEAGNSVRAQKAIASIVADARRQRVRRAGIAAAHRQQRRRCALSERTAPIALAFSAVAPAAQPRVRALGARATAGRAERTRRQADSRPPPPDPQADKRARRRRPSR